MSDKLYLIKPLEWQEIRPDWWTADTIFDTFHVERREDGTCFWRYCIDEFYDQGQHECDSVDDGKAKAQEFYLGRLMPALEESS